MLVPNLTYTSLLDIESGKGRPNPTLLLPSLIPQEKAARVLSIFRRKRLFPPDFVDDLERKLPLLDEAQGGASPPTIDLTGDPSGFGGQQDRQNG